MKEIPLTRGRVALVDDADYGRVNKHRWYAHPNGRTFYAVRSGPVNGKRATVRMHRFILGITDPSIEVDHRDGNGLDNRRANLRVCTTAQNQHNQGLHRDNISGLRGVHWHKRDRKWQAQIKLHGKQHHLGYFVNKRDAADAYAKAAHELHRGFANVVSAPSLPGGNREGVIVVNKLRLQF